MKNSLSILLIGLLLALISCQKKNERLGDFNLLPLPQQYELKGISNLKYTDIHSCFSQNKDDLPVLGELLENIKTIENQSNAQIVYTIDTDLEIKDEGYTLDISNEQINIVGKDEAGLFYAFMTLEQLMIDAQEQDVYLPLCQIKDFPSLSYRAIHLDVKHHLEKTDYYYNLLDKLASYKVNAIIAELEDKIAYKRQPLVGSADALSIAEWQNISDYANERNIEISPLIQGLGHASFILKHDQYVDLRDDPKSDWAFNPLDPKTYDVQFDLYLDAIEATPHGKYLHIGGDEVHTTGRKSGKSPLELQLIWLDKVSKFAEKHGRTPIFWDDMPLKHAEVYRPMFNPKLTQQQVDSIWAVNEHKLVAFLDQFPKKCIYMRWNYSASEALGNSKAMEWFIQNGFQVMGATAGQTRWVLMPQSESNIDNINSFTTSSVEKGLNGLLLTLWDDDSPHFELYMRGIIAFAEYTWTGLKRAKGDLKSAYRHREFSNTLSGKENAFIDQLEHPVVFWKNALLKGNQRNYLKRSPNAMEEMVIGMPDNNKKGAWSKIYERRLEESVNMLQDCDSIEIKIKRMKANTKRNTYTLEVYEQVNKLARFAPEALLALKSYDTAENEQEELAALKQIRQLSQNFGDLRKEFEEVYGKTRILTKPANYILDQDHHVHLANQSISFDWQFYAEILFLEKVERELWGGKSIDLN